MTRIDTAKLAELTACRMTGRQADAYRALVDAAAGAQADSRPVGVAALLASEPLGDVHRTALAEALQDGAYPSPAARVS